MRLWSAGLAAVGFRDEDFGSDGAVAGDRFATFSYVVRLCSDIL